MTFVLGGPHITDTVLRRRSMVARGPVRRLGLHKSITPVVLGVVGLGLGPRRLLGVVLRRRQTPTVFGPIGRLVLAESFRRRPKRSSVLPVPNRLPLSRLERLRPTVVETQPVSVVAVGPPILVGRVE